MATKQWIEENQELMRKFRRDWFERNKQHGREQVLQRKRELKAWFREYKSTCACMTCGENHPACLQFHHRDPESKDIDVAITNGWGRKRILEEIAKCDVVCANCHAKLHWKE